VFNSFDQKPFTNFYDEKNLGPARELSRVIQGYWTNFAKTGDPNGSGLPEWKPYTRENPFVQILDLTVRTEKSDMSDRCAVWDGYNQTRTPIFETLARKEKGKRRN
jgi:carboxylesterase type B